MRLLSRLLSLIVILALLAGGWLAWFATTPVHLRNDPVEFEIRPGSGLRASAQALAEVCVDLPAWQFSLLGRLAGRASDIKAGSYELAGTLTPWQILDKLSRGDVSQSEITFVEGWTFRQLRSVLDANPDVRHASAGLSDRELLVRLGAGEVHPEGLFFPDTYLFARNSDDLAVLRRAYRAMQRRLASEWQQRDPAVPYANAYEALIMASIVEKETGRPSDRPMVASVFVNRLRLGMLLQTDPSVIYGLGERFDGNLRKRDLLADGPYNTYARAGLPPTPIALPGAASLHAALQPPNSDKLYFVARGDGSSEFSRTLAEHNRAVDRYQRRRQGGNK
jgi:UPF0755 protein